MPAIALADANNFYCSCEERFDPSLADHAVVVLSNNDGNVIARNELAKALGIEMCAPAHEIRDLVKKHDIKVFSSNYGLYGDMSHRFMSVLARYTDYLEIYSIDEAFFFCIPRGGQTLIDYAREVRQTVRQWIGLPIGIGIAPTRTLAKLANKRAKKDKSLGGVLDLTACDLDALLEETPCEKIWGIGDKKSAKLERCGITNARQLRDMDDGSARKLLTVVGYRTVLELRGIDCVRFTDPSPERKSFICSRAFGRPVIKLEELKEAVALHASRAGEKLRRDKLAAGYISVWCETNPYREVVPQHSGSKSVRLSVATSYTPHLIAAAESLMQQIYRKGYLYHRVGVTVSRISRDGQQQLPLLEPLPDMSWERAAMEVMDEDKREHGGDGYFPSWEMKRNALSPAYTTDPMAFPVADVEVG